MVAIVEGFWPLTLLWLPAAVVAQAAIRFLPARDAAPDSGMWVAAVPMAAASLVVRAGVMAWALPRSVMAAGRLGQFRRESVDRRRGRRCR